MIPSQEGGPPARLPALIPLPALVLVLGAFLGAAGAGEDFFEAALGLDDLGDIGTSPGQEGPSWPEAAPFPGFAPPLLPDPSAPAVPLPGASLGTAYGNLIRKDGYPSFAHGDLAASAEVRASLGRPGPSAPAGEARNPFPALSIRSALEQVRRERRIGDSSLTVDQGTRNWESRTSIAFPLFRNWIPVLGIAWNSGASREQALLGAALLGRTRTGVSWALSTGRRSLDFPLDIDLPDYKPMGVPFLFRQDFHALAVAARKGPAEFAWSGRLRLSRRPPRQAGAYALTDSGSLGGQSVRLAWSAAGPGGPWRADAKLVSGSGWHHFKGTSLDGASRYQFGYLRARQRSLAVRSDVRMEAGPWRWSAFAGASALEWNAYRPEVPAGRHFWDRNGVLDSYEGSLVGIFNRETWLMDGDVKLARSMAGAALDRGAPGRLGGRLGLAWQRLDLSARSHVTKRTSTLILAYTREEVVSELPGWAAHLLVPDLALRLPLGAGASLEASVSQAVPVKVDIRRTGAGSPGGRDRGAPSGLSGGTRAVVRVGWNMP